MKRVLYLTISTVILLVIGCGGAAELIKAPQISAVIMDSTSLIVMWEEDTTIEHNVDFQGYNIYVSTDSVILMVEDGEDLNKHNAAAITDLSYEITDLNQDSIYYVQVRVVNTENKVGSYNDSLPFIDGSPRPEFTLTVSFEQSSADSNEANCGLRFETAAVTNESLHVFPGADIFFARRSDTLKVCSASTRTAAGFTPRNTSMHNYEQIEFDSLYAANPNDNYLDQWQFVVGDLIVFETEEGNYVKLYVNDYDSVAATIDIRYAYQNILDYPKF